MRDLLPQIDAWLADGQRVSLATVVKVWGSAPRPLGSKMAVATSGGMAGSVSGGCVEGAVVEEAQSVLATGVPKLVSFGVSNDDAFAVGLSCGGTIEIFLERWDSGSMAPWRKAVEDRRLVARALVLRSDQAGRQALLWPEGVEISMDGSLGRDDWDRQVRLSATNGFATLGSRRERDLPDDREGDDPGHDLFVDVTAPPPRLVIVGAVHAAVHLVAMAKEAGFETIVVDPRTAFATKERFSHADRLLHSWPDEALLSLDLDANSYVALLSHDLKLDVPALRVALPRARYVGALGSRNTHHRRLTRLAEEAGIEGALAERIHNPIGLDLGGRRAEEIAVSVLAEVVGVSHGVDYRPIP
ncbi:MAG: XdhC family protein [Thermoanaerobaculia bacterium]|nr:XdhC family protein [Thermoanaerobaculia bacterium]